MKTIREPILFKKFPNLKGKVPFIPLITNAPTPVERLSNLEKHLNLKDEKIFIKRDDKDHDVYGGNKLRKFEFIFGKILKKKRKGVITLGGIGTNQGLACAIMTQQLGLKCHLFLAPQPLTWHVQRSLLLYDYFGAKLHLSKSNERALLKSLVFRLFHPGYFLIPFGATPIFGFGTSLGTVGFIDAMFELKEQIDQGMVPIPDVIFCAGGSIGTSAGLAAGCKLLGLKTKIYAVKVSEDIVINPSNFLKVANKALKYLHEQDPSLPLMEVSENDFKIVEGFRGSSYGIVTEKSQNAVDIVYELEGKERGFKLDTTYTGKTMAALMDYITKKENKGKTVLFWNTYNSNNLDDYLKETEFNYKKLPRKFHKFYEKTFQCWQIMDCPDELRKKCPAYLNQEYRFWKITDCPLSEEQKEHARKQLEQAIIVEKK
ncbi:MAG: 1-aminocyclopropane-1-carboxylate deaminase/D-cysteine desulfhydrase [Promethearchaeota archaeon]